MRDQKEQLEAELALIEKKWKHAGKMYAFAKTPTHRQVAKQLMDDLGKQYESLRNRLKGL